MVLSQKCEGFSHPLPKTKSEEPFIPIAMVRSVVQMNVKLSLVAIQKEMMSERASVSRIREILQVGPTKDTKENAFVSTQPLSAKARLSLSLQGLSLQGLPRSMAIIRGGRWIDFQNFVFNERYLIPTFKSWWSCSGDGKKIPHCPHRRFQLAGRMARGFKRFSRTYLCLNDGNYSLKEVVQILVTIRLSQMGVKI